MLPREQEQRLSTTGVVTIACVVGGLCFAIGTFVGARSHDTSVFADLGAPQGVDLAPVWKAWKVIDEEFVPVSVATATQDKIKDPTQEKVWGMIGGLAESLGDPYTHFLPPVESKQFADDMSGAFEGVGMEIAVRDQILTIVSPLKGTPAERAGLKAGDRILKIDELETRGLEISDAVQKIRGPKGTIVTLLVVREGWNEAKEIKVTRDVINVPILTSEKRKDGVYVIELSSFTSNAPLLFRNALRDFVDSGSDKLILDLRGNPGGFLDAAVDMASWFLPSGAVVVTEDYGGNRDEIVHRSRGYNVFTDKLKMVILVDRGSASASEILALALKSYGKAKLVGTTTFGKGSVQELVDITPETSLKITVARWLGPQGEHIPVTGIVPDVEVKVEEEDVKEGKDVQMEKAVELLK